MKDACTNQDQRVGVEIIERALRRPAETIASNAGVSGDVVAGTLMKEDDYNRGYDAATGNYVNMVDSGIIDPTKVWEGRRRRLVGV